MSFNYLNPKAITRHSPVEGKGTFVVEEIRAGELIAIFGGKVMDFATWEKLPEQAQKVCIQIHAGFVLGPRNDAEAGDGDFINHSCEPNGGIKGQIFIEALRDIKPGEEITFDYGTVIFGADADYWEMRCNCKAKSCRGKVTSHDWQDKAFQKKYQGYLSFALEEKIAAEKKQDAFISE